MKKITLCADDYGMHPTVSEGIIDLIQQQRIHATSCLVTSEYWAQAAAVLCTIIDKADIGLHLNFTEGSGLSHHFHQKLPGLGRMLLSSHLGWLNAEHLREEIKAQFQTFIETTNRLPDFLDGHQHVHHLPQMRDSLFSVLDDFALPESFWVRSVSPLLATTGGIKNKVILHSGAKHLCLQLKQKQIKTNSAFAGIYSLAPNEPFSDHMQHWLQKLPDKSLIMCHPAKRHQKSKINHAEARYNEYNYLCGSEFLNDCSKNHIELVRLSRTL